MPLVGVALLVVAAAVNADVGVSAETRAGRAPIVPAAPPQSATISAVTPMAGAEASTHLLLVRLQYSPRLSWVFTQGADSSTKVLHQGALTFQGRPVPGSSWTARAAAETGETDYAALTQLLGRNQSAVPTVVKGFTMFQGSMGGTQDLTRTWRFEVGADAVRRLPLLSTTKSSMMMVPTPAPAGSPATPVYQFPNQTQLSLAPAISHL